MFCSGVAALTTLFGEVVASFSARWPPSASSAAAAATMNREKLMKMASAVRTGGKGSVRRSVSSRPVSLPGSNVVSPLEGSTLALLVCVPCTLIYMQKQTLNSRRLLKWTGVLLVSRVWWFVVASSM